MHPKSLLDICVDFVVDATVSFQRYCLDNEAVWRDVGHLWEDLWYLPPSVHGRATQLLHAHLLHAQFLHGSLDSYVYDVTRPLLTLLAVKSRKIAIVPVDRQFASLSFPVVFSDCGVYNEEHQLQELDLTGVDLGLDMEMLLALLPRCPEITVLKLGGNTTPDILQAAKCCFLTVLHISERAAKEPRVTENDLIDIILGSRSHSSTELLNNVRCGRILDVKPTWPRLLDFSTGYCKLSESFLVLFLVMFKKIQYLSSKSLDLQNVIHAFNDLTREVPDLHRLSLKTCHARAGEDFLDTLSQVTTKLEDLKIIYRRRSIHGIIGDMLKINDDFPYLKSLHLYGLRHVGLGELPAEIFVGIGMRLRALELDEICLRDVASLLQVFPLLQDVTLTFKHGIKCSHPDLPEAPRFENVISLKVKSHRLRHEPLNFLLSLCPKLQTLNVQGRVYNVEMFLGYLAQLLDLRIVKLTELEDLDVVSLCDLPRLVSDRRPWELYVSPHILTRMDIKTLQNCGWTYIPFRAYNFKIGNLLSISPRHW
ncbi:uncharacterized protein LOC121861944 [Homarus americanus]|nr:uncharacterized protein LOC121861944 [Homarus americanus]